jgi:NAD(P)H-flavin reductase
MRSKIVSRKDLSEQFCRLEIKTSGAFSFSQPGQYIILRMKSDGAGITLPVVKVDTSRETLTVIASFIPEELAALRNPCASGNDVELEGPFGQSFQVENYGSVLCISDQDGLIPLFPILSTLRASGNHIISLLTGPVSRDQIIGQEIRNISDDFVDLTNATSGEISRSVEQCLRIKKVDQIFVIGSAQTIRDARSVYTVSNTPVQTMLYQGEQTRNGQHGIFRVSVCGSARSLCVDGYNFNAYYTNFDELIRRLGDHEVQSRKKLSFSV